MVICEGSLQGMQPKDRAPSVSPRYKVNVQLTQGPSSRGPELVLLPSPCSRVLVPLVPCKSGKGTLSDSTSAKATDNTPLRALVQGGDCRPAYRTVSCVG